MYDKLWPFLRANEFLLMNDSSQIVGSTSLNFRVRVKSESLKIVTRVDSPSLPMGVDREETLLLLTVDYQKPIRCFLTACSWI